MTHEQIDQALRQLRAMLYTSDPRQAPNIWAAIRELEAKRDAK